MVRSSRRDTEGKDNTQPTVEYQNTQQALAPPEKDSIQPHLPAWVDYDVILLFATSWPPLTCPFLYRPYGNREYAYGFDGEIHKPLRLLKVFLLGPIPTTAYGITRGSGHSRKSEIHSFSIARLRFPQMILYQSSIQQR